MAAILGLDDAFIVTLVLLISWAAYRCLPWLQRSIVLSRLPSPKGNLLFGHLEALNSPDHHKIMTKWAAEFGGIYLMRLLHIHAVIVTDPSLVAAVLDKSNEVEKNSKAVYSKFNVLNHAEGLGNIFTSPSDEHWRLVRKGIMPAFNSINIRKGFHHVVQANNQLIGILKSRGPEAVVDMDNAASRITLDVIGMVGFQKDFHATQNLDDATTNRAFDLMTAGRDEGLKRYRNPFRKFLTFFPSVRSGEQDFVDFRRIMSDLLKDIKTKGPLQDSDVSIAAHLLRIIDPRTGLSLPDDRIAAEIGVLFTGGFETTGHTIAWALFCISQHPEVEQKVVAELDSLGLLVTREQLRPRAMTFDDLNALKYTSFAIKEAMRLFPVTGDGTNRITTKSIRLGKYLIPAETMVWVPFSAAFNSPHNFSQAEHYLPERWEEAEADYAAQKLIEKDGEKSARVKRFYPFSSGNRDCAGQSLARMNYTATVAMLLAAFHFELAEEMGGKEGVESTASCQYLTLAPMKGLLMHCVPRDACENGH